ncbi:hypothetical protein GCM10009117_14210 [Gangjinia marincola]|uniref:Uncharacterized protein n=1 Tax=Gangjinia marincola TaxID=578463 RepID=A0ABP3XWN4_9FLAO
MWSIICQDATALCFDGNQISLMGMKSFGAVDGCDDSFKLQGFVVLKVGEGFNLHGKKFP